MPIVSKADTLRERSNPNFGEKYSNMSYAENFTQNTKR